MKRVARACDEGKWIRRSIKTTQICVSIVYMLENRHYYRRARSHNRPPNGIIIISHNNKNARLHITYHDHQHHLCLPFCCLWHSAKLDRISVACAGWCMRRLLSIVCCPYLSQFLGQHFISFFVCQPTRLASCTFFSPSKVKCLCRWNVKLTRLCASRSHGWGV